MQWFVEVINPMCNDTLIDFIGHYLKKTDTNMWNEVEKRTT